MSGRWPSRLSRDQAGVKEILFFLIVEYTE